MSQLSDLHFLIFDACTSDTVSVLSFWAIVNCIVSLTKICCLSICHEVVNTYESMFIWHLGSSTGHLFHGCWCIINVFTYLREKTAL